MAGRHSPPDALNLDVIREIISFMGNKDDLFAVMCTCRGVYPEAIKRIAQIWGSSLGRDELQSFHDFVTRDRNAPNSYTGLHELCVHWAGITAAEAGLVEKLVLGGSQNLTRLSLPDMDEIDAQGSFTSAVASLKKLKYLTASSDSSGALRSILSRLKSPIAEMNLSLSAGHDDDDPVLYLDNFASTLQELSLHIATPSRGRRLLPKAHLSAHHDGEGTGAVGLHDRFPKHGILGP